MKQTLTGILGWPMFSSGENWSGTLKWQSMLRRWFFPLGWGTKLQGYWLIDWQLIVGWGTDSSNAEVLDFTTIPYTIIVSCSHLNYPWLNFGNSDVIILCFLIIKSGFLFMWSICTTINPDCGNHHIRWLFKDKSWGQRFAPTGD